MTCMLRDFHRDQMAAANMVCHFAWVFNNDWKELKTRFCLIQSASSVISKITKSFGDKSDFRSIPDEQCLKMWIASSAEQRHSAESYLLSIAQGESYKLIEKKIFHEKFYSKGFGLFHDWVENEIVAALSLDSYGAFGNSMSHLLAVHYIVWHSYLYGQTLPLFLLNEIQIPPFRILLRDNLPNN